MFDTMFTDAERERRRIRPLDGLRALAIILVLSFHTLLTIYLNARKGAVITVFDSTHITWLIMNSWTGVNLFFVLSGFLIAMQLIDIFSQPPAWHGLLLRQYARKRFCRIAPAYYVVVIPSLLTLHGLRGIPQQEWPMVMASYLFFMQDYFYPALLTQYWSLGVEAKFYALAPAVVMFLSKLRLDTRYASIGVIIAALVLMRIIVASILPPVTSEFSYFTIFRTPFHMAIDSLMVGIAACFIWRDERFRRLLDTPIFSNMLFAAGTFCFASVCAFTKPYFLQFPAPVTFFYETLFFMIVSFSFAAMLLGLLGPNALAPLFGSWPVRIIAELSYSVYLVHLLFVKRAMIYAHDVVPDPTNLTAVWCSSFICLLVYVVPVAAIIYICVERPINRWARKADIR